MSAEPKSSAGFLATLKGKVILLTVIAGGIAAFLGNLKTITGFFSNSFSSKVTVKGIVINSDRSPADRAHLKLIAFGKGKSDSTITISSEEGSFQFGDVKTKGMDEFRIDVSWKDKTTSYSGQLHKDIADNSITITLPDLVLDESSNPLSFTYYNIKGHAIDYLLEGKIDPGWERKLSRNPYIITNEVFKTISNLRNKFYYTNDPNMEFDFSVVEVVKKDKSSREIEGAKAMSLKRYMAATHDYADEEERGPSSDDFYVREADVASLVGENLKQRLKTQKRNFIYNWFPDRGQLEMIRKAELAYMKVNLGEATPGMVNKVISLLLEITKNHYPDSLVKASIYYDDDPCIDGWIIQLLPPCLSLKTVLIENPTSETISIGDFQIKQAGGGELKIHELSASTQYQDSTCKYFPLIKLKPGKAIVLPVELVVKTVQKKQLSLGPVQKIASIEIEKDKYAVRKEDTQNIFMYDGSGGIGSCPYVYTFSGEENTWLLEDHIIYGNNSKAKEKEHTLVLQRFNGTIEVRELDPETSFIDYLYIRHTFPDGKIVILQPDLHILTEKDNQYLRLNRGDKVVLQFPQEADTRGEYAVISFGYYIAH